MNKIKKIIKLEIQMNDISDTLIIVLILLILWVVIQINKNIVVLNDNFLMSKKNKNLDEFLIILKELRNELDSKKK